MAQTLLRRMPVGEGIVEMILDLVRACRPGDPAAPAYVNEQVAWGPGPRAAQALMLAVRAEALLTGPPRALARGRARLAGPVLKHRMALSFAARAEGAQLDRAHRARRHGATRVEAAA
jgi:MoxR-like ATPase